MKEEGTVNSMARHGSASDDGATIAAIGAAAYLLADVLHEVVGHGTVCLMHGGRITLLTSVLFRCSVRAPSIAIAGPAANLAAAGGAGLVLSRRNGANAGLRLFMLLTFALNLFWSAGGMVLHGITNQDDWAIAVARRQPLWLWRLGLVAIGSGLYLIGIRCVVRTLSRFGAADRSSMRDRTRRLVWLPYVAAGMAACIAAAFYAPDPLRAVREGALETFAASAGLLVPALWAVPCADVSMPLPPIRRNVPCVAVVGVAFVVFTALLGRSR